jgi:hypothetical protein
LSKVKKRELDSAQKKLRDAGILGFDEVYEADHFGNHFRLRSQAASGGTGYRKRWNWQKRQWIGSKTTGSRRIR